MLNEIVFENQPDSSLMWEQIHNVRIGKIKMSPLFPHVLVNHLPGPACAYWPRYDRAACNRRRR